MNVEFITLTEEQRQEQQMRLQPVRKAKVEAKCPNGHDWSKPGAASNRCRRCTYFESELRAWKLLTGDIEP